MMTAWILAVAAFSMAIAVLLAVVGSRTQSPAQCWLLLGGWLFSYPVVGGLWIWQAYRFFLSGERLISGIFAFSAIAAIYYGLKAARERRLTFWHSA
jgi:hypothetical protein